jgi:PAS domain S-box-containing protein
VATQNRPAGSGTVQPPPTPKRAEDYSGLQKLWYADIISPKIWTVAWLVLGTTALALIALIAGLVLRLERQYLVTLQHTHVILESALNVLANTESAEAREREYLFTGDRSYIKPYQGSRKDLDEEFDRLRALVKNNPEEGEEVEKLRYLVHRKLDELQAAIDIRTAAGPEAARTLVLTGRSQQLMDAIRKHVSVMEGEGQSTLARFSRERLSRLQVSLAALVGSVCLAACGLLIGHVALTRSTTRRQRVEEELRASNSRFETLCEQAPLGIYETDAGGRCVYTNRMWTTISGLSATESLGHGWAKVLQPDDRRKMFKGWQAAAQRGTTWEYRLLNTQGETRWIRAVGGPLYSEGGSLTGYVGTLEDVTERKQAVQALKDSEALNRAVLNSLPANIAVLKPDGKIQATNEAWRRFAQANGAHPPGVADTGANYLEVCKRAAVDGSEDAQKALAGIQNVLAGLRPSFEMQYPCHSLAEKRWFHMLVTRLAGAVGGVVIAHVDITQRKQAEQRFRLVVEAAPSGMVMVDRDGKIVLVNSRTEKLFGYERKELLGQSIEMLVPESLREKHAGLRAEYFGRTLAGPMGNGRDVYARRKDGTQVPVEVGLNPIQTEQGTWVLSSITDITERRRAEEERQKFVSLADRSLEFIGMCDLNFRWFYVNPAGLRLVGLDNLEAACQIKVQDYFFAEDQQFLTNEFFPRVERDGQGQVEIRFRHVKTNEAIWMLYNVFGICDSRGAVVGWATVSVDITERRRAESSLQKSRHELRALAGRLINAEEEERKRISRELHDDLSQKLAMLAFDTGSLVLAPPPSMDEMREPLRNLQARVVQLSQHVRQISHQLHPTILEDLGLTAALSELCDEFSAREGIEVAFEQQAMPKNLPVDVASCLYRVAQEALHNVSKHARATQVRLKISGSPEAFHLCIYDNGVGFDSRDLHQRGLGIVSMKERVGMVQGEFSIHSQPGRGTEVKVFVPLSKGIE